MNETVTIVLWLVAAAAGVVASAIFSGVETGVYRLNRIRLRLRSESGDPRARTLVRLLRNQRSLLATLLIGVNIANYLSSSAIVALWSLTRLAEWQIAVVAPIITAPVLLIVAEIVPKNIFQVYSDRYTYSFAGLLKWFRRGLLICGLLPLVDAVTGLLIRLTSRSAGAGAARAAVAGAGRGAGATDQSDQLFHPRQQVGRLITESIHQGTLTPYQSFLVDRVMNLRNVRVAQVMVPLAKVAAAPADVSREQFIASVRGHHHAHVLAFQGRPANAVGVIRVNEVLAAADPAKPIAGFVRQVPRLKPDSPLVHALFAIQRTSDGFGVVADKNGAALGIVTIQDLLDEIVGEIEEW